MKRCLLLIVGLVVAGCSDGLTFSGYQARPISLLSAADCTLVGQVSDVRQDVSSAVRDNATRTAQARNRAASLGGNAIALTVTSSTSGSSSYQTNAYRCPSVFLGQ